MENTNAPAHRLARKMKPLTEAEIASFENEQTIVDEFSEIMAEEQFSDESEDEAMIAAGNVLFFVGDEDQALCSD